MVAAAADHRVVRDPAAHSTPARYGLALGAPPRASAHGAASASAQALASPCPWVLRALRHADFEQTVEAGKVLRNVYPPVTAEPRAFAWGPLGSLSRARELPPTHVGTGSLRAQTEAPGPRVSVPGCRAVPCMSREQQPGREQAQPCLTCGGVTPTCLLGYGIMTARKEIFQNVARPGAKTRGLVAPGAPPCLGDGSTWPLDSGTPSQAPCGLFFLDNQTERARSLSERDSVCLKRRRVLLSQTLPRRGKHGTSCSKILLNSKSESQSRKIKPHKCKISTKKKKNSHWKRPRCLCRSPIVLERVRTTGNDPGRGRLWKVTPPDNCVP